MILFSGPLITSCSVHGACSCGGQWQPVILLCSFSSLINGLGGLTFSLCIIANGWTVSLMLWGAAAAYCT